MSSQISVPNSEAAILARMLESEKELGTEAARYLLSIKLPSGDDDRVDELSAKAREGSLTEAESRELDAYLRVASVVAVLHRKRGGE